MASFRDVKLRMRRRLHRRMKLAAFYYPQGETDQDPILIAVRVHTMFGAEGDVKGTSFSYAERNSEEPKLVFMVEDQGDGFEAVRPKRGDVVLVSNGEGYKVDNTMPPDPITITANVTRMSKSEVEDYDFPDGTTGAP